MTVSKEMNLSDKTLLTISNEIHAIYAGMTNVFADYEKMIENKNISCK